MRNDLIDWEKVPLVTLGFGMLAIMFQLTGASGFDVLIWRSDWVETGDYWRFLTGHLIHVSHKHLAWDLVVFMLLGSYLEQRSRRGVVVVIAMTVFLTELFLRAGGRFEVYCGLSAIDMGLFGFAALHLITRGKSEGDRVLTVLGTSSFVLVVAKCAIELFGERAVFAGEFRTGFELAAESHLAGLVGAVLVCVFASRLERKV